MGAPLEGDHIATDEWFLKRCGTYEDDVIIYLNQDEVVIGRRKNKHLKRSPGVSRKHAMFKKADNDHWLVKDLGSTNGLYINRRKIISDHLEPVREADIIGLGVATAVSNDQFSFTLCRQPKCLLNSEIHITQESPRSPKECCIKSEHDNKSSENSVNLNVNKSVYTEQEWKEHNGEISHSPKFLVESEQHAVFGFHKSENMSNVREENFSIKHESVECNRDCSTSLSNCVNESDYHHKSKLVNSEPTAITVSATEKKPPQIQDNRNTSLHEICDRTKLNCRVLVKRCDNKINCKFVNSISRNVIDSPDVDMRRDINKTSKQEISESEDSDECANNFHTKSTAQKIIISDTDSTDNDVPHKNYKLHKRKRVISSENSDSSDELSQKSIFPITVDSLYRTKKIDKFDITKEENISHQNDSKIKTLVTHCEDHSESRTANVTKEILKTNVLNPESDMPSFIKKEQSDLKEGTDSMTASDDVPLENTKCNVPQYKVPSSDVLNKCIVSAETKGSENICKTQNRSKLSDMPSFIKKEPSDLKEGTDSMTASDDVPLENTKCNVPQYKVSSSDVLNKCVVPAETKGSENICETQNRSKLSDIPSFIKKEPSDLKEGTDSMTASDDVPLESTKCNVPQYKVPSSDVLNKCIVPAETKGSENMCKTQNRSKLSETLVSDVITLDEDDFVYSQCDNIIIISDDEDTPTVKKEPNEFLTFKSEPLDPDDIQIKREVADDEILTCEAADDVLDFGNDTSNVDERELLGRIIWPPAPESVVDDEIPESDFFPILSQSFYSEDSSSETSSHSDTKQANNIECELIKNKETRLAKNKFLGNKPNSCIQLTEPLPMHRPKIKRGRKEWCAEKNHIGKATNTNSEASSDGSKRKFYGKNLGMQPLKNVRGTISGSKKKNPSFKQRLKEKMGHRVRCPGGGSAVIKQDASNCVSVVPSARTTKAKQNTQWSERIKETTKKLPLELNSLNISKSKNAHSAAPVIQRFPSRTEQLTKSMLVEDSVLDKSKQKQDSSSDKSLGKKSELVGRQKVPVKQNLIPTNHKKAQKRGNPFANFRIPKKVKANEQQTVPSEELNLCTLSNGKNEKLAGPVNNITLQMATAQNSNDLITAVNENKSHTTNDQNPTKKKVRFAEGVTPCVVRDALLPTTKSAVVAKNKHTRDNNALNKITDLTVVPSYTRNCISQENVIAKLVSWNINWLKEQCAISRPPPVVNLKSLRRVVWRYTSVDEHWNTYFDFIMLEVWQSVYQAWRVSENKHTDEFAVIGIQKFNDMMILNCQAAISSSRGRVITFMEGHLAIVELMLKTKNQATAVTTVLGYLCDCKTERYRMESAHALLHSIPPSTASSYHLVNFVLKIKYTEDNVSMAKLMKMKPILYLKPMLRLCEALQNAYDCPLQRCILMPQPVLCSFNNVSKGSLRSRAMYNEKQKQAILGIADAILEPRQPRLLLLHGPPGTGKTHTILGIIQQLLFHSVKNADQHVKILVTAPSNGAVDEIGRRILKWRSHLVAANGKKVRIVRVGQADMVHRDLKMYFIDELLKLNLQNACMERDSATTINHLQAKINKLQQEIRSRQVHNPNNPDIAKKQKELDNCKRELKIFKTGRHGHIDEKQKYRLKIDILTKADVILTTLNSCRQSILESAFGKNSTVTFTCCIVDEATQCTEPEILIPLHYGMNKVLLVGDPYQLPATVFSRLAVEHGFQISLFERLNNHFSGLSGENPVFMLTDQYRMHHEICSYPSSYFYSGLLRSCGVGGYFNNFPLKRYLILDIIDGRESTDNPRKVYNQTEATFVEYICSEILRLIPTSCTLGVITPYQGQRQLIDKYFHTTLAHEIHRTEVNTVDAFQGRERDVVILSCVRASSYSGSIGFLDDRQRLNVAITRARYSLIICGHMASLRSHHHWGCLIRNAESRNLIYPVTSSALDAVYDILKSDPIQR